MDMAISTAGESLARTHAGSKPPANLQDACRQFEGLLVGMVLKESLRDTFTDPGDNASSGMDGFRDFCIEQVSSTLAQTSSLGIADQLLAQMNSGGGSAKARGGM